MAPQKNETATKAESNIDDNVLLFPEMSKDEGTENRAVEHAQLTETLQSEANPEAVKKPSAGMTFKRYYTKRGKSPFDGVKWVKRRSVITEPDGSVVFEMDEAEVPESWSQLATDIMVSKYFRKAGVPGLGHESSVRQVITRITHSIRAHGQSTGYFANAAEGQTFEDELTHLLLHQHAAFNSPVWFNCGLSQQYNIQGSPGNYRWDEATQATVQLQNSYQHPQCSACFIQRVEDDLMGIFDLIRKEARVFKFGSGTGTNFSKLRSKHEHLSGGGSSSGLLSFLEVFDRGAGATKSGGTTRRAAKMVCLDLDHPEIIDFIHWKSKEEEKAKILIAGGMSADFNGEAYHTVSGQNSNNSVRIPDAFMYALQENGTWQTTFRTTGEVYETWQAREIMHEIAQAAWYCADPGVQFDTTINDWHTCAATDRIYASNPCSEFMFLDDTACNLSSINLLHYWNPEERAFDVEGYSHSIRVLSVAMEILVGFSSYPTDTIAANSYQYRPLGLGYANLGALLMVCGLPYDSEEGRQWSAALTAILCGEAYATSAEMAEKIGAFEGYHKNRLVMLSVIDKHRKAALEIDQRLCPEPLREAAHAAWNKAAELGAEHGYRNSQMTVLAPTGTIGLLMDCDTTGVEPDFSLVKWKKLAGGGYIKIVNQSVEPALQALGYTATQVEVMLTHILGTPSLKAACGGNWETLSAYGFSQEELEAAEADIQKNINWNAFTAHVTSKSLAERGMDAKRIEQLENSINGMETIEGAPHLKEAHLAVFDCANTCGRYGKRFIQPMAHVNMMAAVQPFISGAISKTINVPEQTTVEEIESLYIESWRKGLKAVALYRDNCKSSQPLQSTLSKEDSLQSASEADDSSTNLSIHHPALAALLKQHIADGSGEEVLNIWRQRRELPDMRKGFTLSARVGGQKIYLRSGEYDSGELGEIFVDVYKEGAAYRSIMNSFAQAVSVGLQHGVPLEKFVDMFTFTRFEPAGMTTHPYIRQATSILDFIFRVLGFHYLNRTDFLHVLPEEDGSAPSAAIGVPSSMPTSMLPAAESITGMNKSAKSIETPVSSNAPNSTANSALNNSAPNNANALSEHLSEMMGDAPLCDICGHLTVRNGTCYRCLSCGNSIGCS